MSIALCPGSFDPFTLGHRFIVERAAARFEEVIVTVVVNPNKQGMFSVDERLDLIAATCADLPNVRVDRWRGLLVDYMRNEGVTTMIKGLRSSTDFEYEVETKNCMPEATNRFSASASSLIPSAKPW